MKHTLFKYLIPILLGIHTGCASKRIIPDESFFEVGSGSIETPTLTKDNEGERNPTLSPGTIESGNLIEMSQLEDRQLNGRFRVQFDGKLRLPYNVEVMAAGLTVSALREKVTSAYRSYLRSVETLKLAVVESKIEIDVRGLVVKPGRYRVARDAGIDEILAVSGGLVQNSLVEFVQFQGNGPAILVDLARYYDTGDTSTVPPLRGGDRVFFQRRSALNATALESSNAKVRILGEVKTPGQFPFRAESPFLEYFAQAGGPTSVADLSEIEVLRTVNGELRSYVLEWKDARRMKGLRDGDLIVVHAIKQTPFERFLQSGGALAAILSAVGILIIAL